MTVVTDTHKLHKHFGSVIFNLDWPSGCEVVLDQACGGHQQIPLFCSETKSRINQLCKVDILLIQDNHVRILIEIDESDIKPTHVCGKFLTSALASYYIHRSKRNCPIPMANHVLFVQIVDTAPLSTETDKRKQFCVIERNIQERLPLKGSQITAYHLFCVSDVNRETDVVVSCIDHFLKTT